ncbi:MAG TPA: hypothetical protein VGO18_23465, partial [Steroidobacteraceae bacterium]|nr:hypothetical protein [Steroidobacteraceae bacterium]
HIFPIEATAAMPGFACLSKNDQSKIVNEPSNFVGICGSCNSSKSDTLWWEWKEHKVKEIKFSKKLMQEGQEHSAAVATKQWNMIKAAPCPKKP